MTMGDAGTTSDERKMPRVAPAVVSALVGRGELGPQAWTATLIDLARQGVLSFAAEGEELLVTRVNFARTDPEARVLQWCFASSTHPEQEEVGSASWREWADSRPEAGHKWWSDWQDAVREALDRTVWDPEAKRGIFRRRDLVGEARERYERWTEALLDGPGRVDTHPDALEGYARDLATAVALEVSGPLTEALDRRLGDGERRQVARGWLVAPTMAESLARLRAALPAKPMIDEAATHQE